MKTLNSILALGGRLLLAQIFLISGVAKVIAWSETSQYMTDHGLPLVPILLFGAVIIEIGAGLALVLGYQARATSTLLVLYLIPVTLTFHAFWNLEGMDRQLQMINLLKNLAILGGLTQIIAYGARTLSIDAQFERIRSDAQAKITPLPGTDQSRRVG